MRNTKVDLGEEIKNKHLNDFMTKLKNSGYNAKYRKEILDSATKAFEKMLEEDRNNVKPLFRDRLWKKEEREHSKKEKRLNWYKNEGGKKIKYKSILFVPPTPGGILVKQLKEREEELNKFREDRIKIVEKGGIKVENILTKKDPFEKENCKNKVCPICTNESKKLNILCNSNNVGYRWVCQTCEVQNKTKVYEGETARSGRLRGIEHLKQFEGKKTDSVLYKHKLTEHRNEEVKFRMELTGTFKDALSRQAEEAVRIQSRQPFQLMNSKSEFNHPPIARIIVEKHSKNQYNGHRAELSPSL